MANCVSGSRKVAGFVSTSRERGNPRISEPRIRNTSLTSLQEKRNDIHNFQFLSLSIEKGRAVLYSDFVTILRMASMKYIAKLATTQNQKPPPHALKI